MKIKIADKSIGGGESVFVIAEAGINHNGDIKIAKKLINVAKLAGADSVKFQTFKADDVVTENVPLVTYQHRNLKWKKSQLEMLRQYELNYPDFKKLKKYCDKKGIIFLSTPHSEEAADFLEYLVPAFKIGSGDLTNIPFLEKVAIKDKPTILGTGMSTLEEVKDALHTIYAAKNKNVVICCHASFHNELSLSTRGSQFISYGDHATRARLPCGLFRSYYGPYRSNNGCNTRSFGY
jgi:sialic acid synthase SpsE